MAIINLQIPVDEPNLVVTFVYLEMATNEVNTNTNLMYLQNNRSGSLAKAVLHLGLKSLEELSVVKGYYGKLPFYTMDIVRQLVNLNCEISAVVSPPSSHPEDSQPYRTAIRECFQDAIDLTDRFQRSPGVTSGGGAALQEISDGLRYKANGDEAGIISLLIVDDIMSRGRTAAAIIMKLKDAGVSSACRFIVVSPLWIPRS